MAKQKPALGIPRASKSRGTTLIRRKICLLNAVTGKPVVAYTPEKRASVRAQRCIHRYATCASHRPAALLSVRILLLVLVIALKRLYHS